MKKRSILLISLLIVLATILAACSSSGSKASKNMTVTLTDFEFTPMDATVPAGETITLKLINNGAVTHEWALLSEPVEAPFDDQDEAKILYEAEVEAGETKTVTFTAPEAAGEYEIVCAIAGHMEAGMVGKLVVVQP